MNDIETTPNAAADFLVDLSAAQSEASTEHESTEHQAFTGPKEPETMKAFSIDSESNLTALAARGSAAAGTEVFATEKELTALAASWPIARLVEIWNSFAGIAPFGDLKPVKKFENRAKATKRIWDAIQKLDAAPEPQAAKATTKATAAKAGRASQPKAERPAKVAKAKGEAHGGKKAEVIAMLGVEGGATLAAIMAATGWQAHTVRGFMAGALKTKMGLTVNSFKDEAGERTYSLTPAAAAKALAQNS